MKRSLRNLTAVAACMLVLAGALSCGADSSGLVILGHLVVDDECNCVAPTGGTALFRSEGSFDPTIYGSEAEYLACVGLENRLFNQEIFTEDNSITKGLETNSRDIVPEVAEVELLGQEGSNYDGGIPPYRVSLTSRNIPSRSVKGVDIEDRAGYYFTLIPREVSVQLRNHPQISGENLKLVARYRILGHTQDGSSVESDYFDFPLSVCLGCMNFIPPTCPVGSVLTHPAGEAAAAVCLPGQDGEEITCECPEGLTEKNGECVETEAGG